MLTDINLQNHPFNPSFWQDFLSDLVEIKKFKLSENADFEALMQEINKELSFNNVNLKELNLLIGRLVKVIPSLEESVAWQKCIDKIQNARQILFLIDCVKNSKRDTDLQFNFPDLKKSVHLLKQDDVLNEAGANLLILCAKSRNQVVNKLAIECLSLGANPNARDYSNITALHYACQFRNTQLMKALLKKNAGYSVASAANGATPLSLLLKHGEEDAILAFLEERPGVLLEKIDGEFVYVKLLKMAIEGLDDLMDYLEKKLSNEVLQKCGRALFEVACKSNSMKWVQNTIEAATNLSSEEQAFVSQTFSQLAQNKQHSLTELKFLESIWKQGLLPLGPLKKGKSALSIVNNVLHLNLKGPALEVLKEFEDLYLLKSNFLSLDEKSIIERMKRCLSRLQELSYDGYDLYAQRIKEVETAYQNKRQRVLEWLEKFQVNADLKWLSSIRNGSKIYWRLETLVPFCLKENKQHLISPLFDKQLAEQSEFVFQQNFNNLILDKAWMKSPSLVFGEKDKNGGGNISEGVPFFIQNLTRMLESSSICDNAALYNLLSSFVEKFSVASAQLCSFDLKIRNSRKPIPQMAYQVAFEIIEKIKDPLQTHVLIPTGHRSHAALLVIEKNASTTRLIMHNTGAGLFQHHSQWKNSNRYQTFSIIEEVPLEDLENIQLWQNFIQESCEAVSVDGVYACVNELGKRGQQVDCSLYSEDFESKQMNGTCSLQCYLSFFRYQIMTMAEGSKEEKLAIYRLIKAHLISWTIQHSFHRCAKEFKDHIELKLDKYESFIKLGEIAKDESKYQQHLTLLIEHLNKVGVGTFLDSIELTQDLSFTSRLAILEKCSQKLAKHSSFEDIMRAAELWRDRNFTLSNIQAFIKDFVNRGDVENLGLYLASLYNSSRFHKKIQQIIIEIVNSTSDLKKNQALLLSLTSRLNKHEPGRRHLNELCKALIISEQSSLADFIRNISV